MVGIFPDRGSIIGLGGAVLAEQHDVWADGRRYLGPTSTPAALIEDNREEDIFYEISQDAVIRDTIHAAGCESSSDPAGPVADQ